MPSEERDQQFERALQRHLRGDSPNAACPDADTLAAYHERTLSIEELAPWKEHVASCMRCQETLAMLEETNSIALHDWEGETVQQEELITAGAMAKPAVFKETRAVTDLGLDESALGMPEAEVRQKHAGVPHKVERKSWKWMAPAGALAAGLLIFVAVKENHSHLASEQSAVQVAENRAASAPASMPEELQHQIQQTPKVEAPVKSQLESGTEQSKKSQPVQRMTTLPGASSQMSEQSRDWAMREPDKEARDAAARPKGMEGTPAAGRTAPAETQNRTDLNTGAVAPRAPSPPTVNPATGIVGGVAGGAVAAARKQSSADVNQAKTLTGEAEVAQSNAPIPSAAQLSYSASPLREIALKDSHVIVPPAGKHAWRVGAAGQIEATADAGRTWAVQQSGVITELKAGSAPSENVCWVVGKVGTILLTTDGGIHWTLLTFPAKDDLGGVHAIDAQHATIWNTTNRKGFETADGGLTWTPVAKE